MERVCHSEIFLQIKKLHDASERRKNTLLSQNVHNITVLMLIVVVVVMMIMVVAVLAVLVVAMMIIVI
jgi:uncharacterized membrane protein YhaH (DUF805 family)